MTTNKIVRGGVAIASFKLKIEEFAEKIVTLRQFGFRAKLVLFGHKRTLNFLTYAHVVRKSLKSCAPFRRSTYSPAKYGI